MSGIISGSINSPPQWLVNTFIKLHVIFPENLNLFSKMTNLFNPSQALTKASTFSLSPVITSKCMIAGQFYMIRDVWRTQLWLWCISTCREHPGPSRLSLSSVWRVTQTRHRQSQQHRLPGLHLLLLCWWSHVGAPAVCGIRWVVSSARPLKSRIKCADSHTQPHAAV